MTELTNPVFSRHQFTVVCRWRLVSVGRRSRGSTMTWPITAVECSSMEVVTLMLTTFKQRKSVRTPAQVSQVTHTHTHTWKLSFYFEAVHKAKLIRILLMDFLPVMKCIMGTWVMTQQLICLLTLITVHITTNYTTSINTSTHSLKDNDWLWEASQSGDEIRGNRK